MAPPARRADGPPVRALVGLVLVAVVAVRLTYLVGPLRADEAGYLLVARSWHTHGPDLYGSYFVDRPPLLIALFRLASLVPWDPFVRVLTVPFAVLFVVAAAGAGREVAGRRGARWAAVVAGALAVTPAVGAQEADGEIFAAPLVMLAVWAVLASVRRPRHRLLTAAAAGVASGLAVMVKQSFGDGLVFAAVLLVASFAQRRLTARAAGAVLLGGAAGVLAVLGAAAAYAATTRAGVGGGLSAVLGFRSSALTVITAHSMSAPATRAGQLVLLGVVSGAVPLLVLAGREAWRRAGHWSPAGWAVGVTAASELAAIVAGGSFWSHYLIQLAPMLALAAGLGAPRARALRRAAVVVVASAAVAVVGVDAAGAQSTSPEGRLAGEWVGAASRPHDTAVVLFGHAEVLEASGLRSPYPYLWSLPMRTLDPRLRLLRATFVGPVAPTWVVAWTASTRGGSTPSRGPGSRWRRATTWSRPCAATTCGSATVYDARCRSARPADGCAQWALQPPSRTSDVPVIEAAVGLHRNATASATSSGSTSRLSAAEASSTSLEHLGLGDAVRLGLVGDLLVDERGPHVARVDAVRGDAVLGALERDHLREPLETVLGRDVGRLERARRAGRAPTTR